MSFITAFVKSGLRTESRPISARNWISRKETGETPQGRYRSNQGNSARRFEPSTSQTRKWVSRRSVTWPDAAVKRGRAQGATPTTTDPPRRLAGLSGVFCTAPSPWPSWYRSALLAATQCAALSARRRLLHLEELRRGGGTNASSLRTPLPFSCVQCTIMDGRPSTTEAGYRDPLTHYLSHRGSVRLRKFEARNPNFEANSSDDEMTIQGSKPSRIGICVLDFPSLTLFGCGLVRISQFDFNFA